jgi:hypothetical protein
VQTAQEADSTAANGFASAHAHAAAAAAPAAAGADSKVVYSCRTVVMKFRDPTLPHQLSKILKVNLIASWLFGFHAAYCALYQHALATDTCSCHLGVCYIWLLHYQCRGLVAAQCIMLGLDAW